MEPESNIRIRAAALDLDGTIIGPDERITPAVKDAIGRLSARIPVFIATGDPMSGTSLDPISQIGPGSAVRIFPGAPPNADALTCRRPRLPRGGAHALRVASVWPARAHPAGSGLRSRSLQSG